MNLKLMANLYGRRHLLGWWGPLKNEEWEEEEVEGEIVKWKQLNGEQGGGGGGVRIHR